ncbi:Uncharacterised protein [Moraxella bovis]|uniref:Uncharacterized protein n=1 Tax=Moraxella bovis TaxID=476 RepID=A0A378PSG3_MORBO|nr:Uncharacterised protein [Moraxella bovis]
MLKIPFYLLVLLFSSHVHSTSTLAKEDGKILIVLKNNYPYPTLNLKSSQTLRVDCQVVC